MKQLYILSPIYNSVNFSFEIDTIISESKKNDVTVLVCDSCPSACCVNTFGIKLLCSECRKRSEAVLGSIPNIKTIYKSDYKILNQNYEIFKYNSLKELNKISYKGFEIGYGVTSYYIDLTRNPNPKITSRLKSILDGWLHISMINLDLADKIITKEYDLVYVVNGRIFDAKPFQDVGFAKGIHVIMGECAKNLQGQYVRMDFDNVKVHSIKGNTEMILNFWEKSSTPLEERTKIASSFFEKRINKIRTNDKVYIKNQISGLLPDDWDSNKTNIAIFNSSEDEFASLGGEYEQNNLFESQYEGIKYIIENTNDPTIHFYLRIHPNLMHIKYKYHLDLYNLPKNHKNITVIPGDSPVSSYSLMSACERIITFGSTMGVEAAYAGKMTMVLKPCLYYYLNISFTPKTRQEVLDFILGKIDFKPSHENTLKYSYYKQNNDRDCMNNKECEYENYCLNLLGKKFNFYSMNLRCSNIRMYYCLILDLIGVFVSKLFTPRKEN